VTTNGSSDLEINPTEVKEDLPEDFDLFADESDNKEVEKISDTEAEDFDLFADDDLKTEEKVEEKQEEIKQEEDSEEFDLF
jgi:hypothetical protein